MAAWSASAARFEQCCLTGGSPSRASATVVLDMASASERLFPFTSSVTIELVAIAAPHPKALNLTSLITSPSILMLSFMIAPHPGLPTVPTPLGAGQQLQQVQWSLSL